MSSSFIPEIHLNDAEIRELGKCLTDLSELRYDAVAKACAMDIFNRGKVPKTGTPFVTGQLLNSLNAPEKRGTGYIVGYSAEYAPHVEYGHRTVNGGFTYGQYYLRRNSDTERPIFKELLEEQIKRALRK